MKKSGLTITEYGDILATNRKRLEFVYTEVEQMENRGSRLTERQRRFADLYLQLGNAAEAAEQAGFKRSYAQGAKRQPAVRAYMDERLRQAQDKNIASADEVLSFLTDVMRGVYDGEKPERNSSPRMKAAELLGKRLGIFTDVNSVLRQEMPLLVDDIPDAGDAAE